MGLMFKDETYRGDFTFYNSPEAIRHFPFPFHEDKYMYAVNIEPHTPGPKDTAYEFPIDVTVNIGDNIGGPSAGLLFSLAIYDTLTPGSLTGDQVVAGTGTIDEKGKVGPIGGIQQKIVGARDDGAVLFLVPPDNCDDALGARNGDMRLVKAVTMHAAAQAIEKWVKDPDAKLPTCARTTEREIEG
jgi:PDZ domain-containing protein